MVGIIFSMIFFLVPFKSPRFLLSKKFYSEWFSDFCWCLCSGRRLVLLLQLHHGRRPLPLHPHDHVAVITSKNTTLLRVVLAGLRRPNTNSLVFSGAEWTVFGRYSSDCFGPSPIGTRVCFRPGTFWPRFVYWPISNRNWKKSLKVENLPFFLSLAQKSEHNFCFL